MRHEPEPHVLLFKVSTRIRFPSPSEYRLPNNIFPVCTALIERQRLRPKASTTDRTSDATPSTTTPGSNTKLIITVPSLNWIGYTIDRNQQRSTTLYPSSSTSGQLASFFFLSGDHRHSHQHFQNPAGHNLFVRGAVTAFGASWFFFLLLQQFSRHTAFGYRHSTTPAFGVSKNNRFELHLLFYQHISGDTASDSHNLTNHTFDPHGRGTRIWHSTLGHWVLHRHDVVGRGEERRETMVVHGLQA